MAAVAEELQAGKKKKKKNKVEPDPTLQTLAQLKGEGLLEAYILISAPDEGIAQDYAAYRKENRDKLRAYISKYIVPAAPQP